jgi:microcompartment protein CcmK/EutM
VVFVHFEENIQEGGDDPLKEKNSDNDKPVEPVGAGIGQNVMFVSDSSAVEKVEDLHHDKRCKNEGEMA